MTQAVPDENTLISVWLDGFATGTASAALRLVVDATGEDANAFSNEMIAQAVNDPAVIETIRGQIIARLTGVDNGPTILNPTIMQPRKDYP